MGYNERKLIYKKIEEKRDRALLVYVTSLRSGVGEHMSQDVIPQIIKHMNMIEKTEKGIDILIISTGGDAIVPIRIVTLLRDRYKKLGAIVPYTAYSAATLLVLGADEIIMHPYSNLGPVDPQLVVNKKDQQPMAFAYEDIKKYIEFIKDIGISDQDLMEKAFELLTKEVGTVPIGFAKRSSQLALTASEKLLSLHMEDKAKAKTISEQLNTAFYHHGYPLAREEAKQIGLNIVDSDEEMEGYMWEICEDFSEEMKFNQPFNLQEIVANNIKSNFKTDDIGKVKKELVNFKTACVESIKGQSYIEQCININYKVDTDMNIAQNVLKYPSTWIFEKGDDE